MSVYKINNNLPLTTKIELLNSMILELNGLVSKGRFDENEITSIYADVTSINRAYLRNVSLGHSYSNYTNWTHVHAQSGYSIWKLQPSSFLYSALNQLYFDNKVLDNKGAADSETLTSFDKVFVYDGSYTDNTTEAATESGTPFDLIDDTGQYLYVGASAVFSGISFEFSARGSNYTLDAEYWNGSAWTDLEFSGNDFTDNTTNFQSDGNIVFEQPGDWATTSVNSQTKYWIRISTTTTPVTTAKAYLIIPSNSVIALLTLSSDKFFKEQWAWCSYNGYIYVTIRNSGVSAYEGNAFVTSSSSTVNKQNFFVVNHEFTLDYLNSTYSGASSIIYEFNSGETLNIGDLVCIVGADNLGLADASDITKIAVAVCTNNVTGEIVITNSNRVNDVNTEGGGDIVVGDLVYLSTTAGKVSKNPSASGSAIIQEIGRAITNESGSKVDILLNIQNSPIEIESGA